MHICHLTQSVSTNGGGIAEAVRAMSMAQCADDARVSVLSPRDGGGPLAPWPPDSPGWLRAQRLPGILRFPDLSERLDQSMPDVAHVHGLWTWLSIGVPRWAARNSRPHLASPHGMLDGWALACSKWKKRAAASAFENRHLSSASCIHALCRPECDSIRAYGLKNPVCIIPNGVDLPEIGEIGEIGDRKSEIGDQKKTLLFLGRIHPKKNLTSALRAWNEIRRQGTGARGREEWTFAIAGWDQGGHEAELKELATGLGIRWADVRDRDAGSSNFSFQLSEFQLLFTGPAFGEAKDQLLRSASAFILPSLSEGLPMAVLEAMAYRLPVLLTDHCNLPEAFTANAAIRIGTDVGGQKAGDRGQGTGVGGQVLPINEGMRVLFDMTDAERKTMGQRGRALVERQFTWPQVAAQMKEVYEWVLGGGEKPGCVWD